MDFSRAKMSYITYYSQNTYNIYNTWARGERKAAKAEKRKLLILKECWFDIVAYEKVKIRQ
jgi:hypothetical protein